MVATGPSKICRLRGGFSSGWSRPGPRASAPVPMSPCARRRRRWARPRPAASPSSSPSSSHRHSAASRPAGRWNRTSARTPAFPVTAGGLSTHRCAASRPVCAAVPARHRLESTCGARLALVRSAALGSASSGAVCRSLPCRHLRYQNARPSERGPAKLVYSANVIASAVHARPLIQRMRGRQHGVSWQ
jgi:hypothetical protein